MNEFDTPQRANMPDRNDSGEPDPDINALLAATQPQVDEAFRRQMDARLEEALSKRQTLSQQTARASERRTAPLSQQIMRSPAARTLPPPAHPRRFGWLGSFVTGAIGLALLVLLFIGLSALFKSREQPVNPVGAGVPSATAVSSVPATPASLPTQIPNAVPTRMPTAITPIPQQSPVPTDTPIAPVAFPSAQAPAPVNLMRIEMQDEQHGWGLSRQDTTSGTVLVHTADGGRSWYRVVPTDVLGAPVQLGDAASVLDVYALDASTAWVAIAPDQNTKQVAIYRTYDGGQSWASTTVPADNVFVEPYPHVSIAFVGALNGWMTVYGPAGMSTTPGQLYSTTDGGGTWTQIAVTGGGGELQPTLAAGQIPYGGDIYFHDANTGWIVGSMAGTDVHHLYITTDGGRDWQEQQLAVTEGGQQPDRINVLAPPRFFSVNNGAIEVAEIRDTDQGTETSAAIFVTSDGGHTWQSGASTPGSDFAPASLLDVNNWWVWYSAPHDTNSKAAVQGNFYHTINGNQAWNVPTSITHPFLVTWTQIPPDPHDALTVALQADYDVTQVAFVSPTTGWALLQSTTDLTNTNQQPNLLLKTTDGGTTWAK